MPLPTPTFTRAHQPLAPLPREARAYGERRVWRELAACTGLGVIVLPLALLGGAADLLGDGVAGLVGAWLGGGAVLRVAMLLGRAAGGRALGAFLAPTGDRTPYAYDFSREQALVQRGDVAGALAAYEAHLAARPDDAEARLRAAALHAGAGGDPQRAAALLREVRRIPGLPAEQDVHAANRLIDLYAGPLAEPGRALVELRRLADRYPGTPLAESARRAIARQKGEGAAER